VQATWPPASKTADGPGEQHDRQPLWVACEPGLASVAGDIFLFFFSIEFYSRSFSIASANPDFQLSIFNRFQLVVLAPVSHFIVMSSLL